MRPPKFLGNLKVALPRAVPNFNCQNSLAYSVDRNKEKKLPAPGIRRAVAALLFIHLLLWTCQNSPRATGDTNGRESGHLSYCWRIVKIVMKLAPVDKLTKASFSSSSQGCNASGKLGETGKHSEATYALRYLIAYDLN
ncbi:unnamed protein product [Timema podura]|uniref:Uncharacterized protein n=1 Tax=Timema podura TaxID=61482 RepID=A0ABN7NWT0_TIMPD|nr:unnamed protein product [Timema podura]